MFTKKISQNTFNYNEFSVSFCDGVELVNQRKFLNY